jgi:hypothetical protein
MPRKHLQCLVQEYIAVQLFTLSGKEMSQIDGYPVLPRVSRRSERRGWLSYSCPLLKENGRAPGRSVLQTDGSTTLPCARRKWGDQVGLAPHTTAFTEPDANSYIIISIKDPASGAAPGLGS